MDKQNVSVRGQSRLLPQFENQLVASAVQVSDEVVQHSGFPEIRQALHWIFDQSAHLPSHVLAQQVVDLLQADLGVDYMMIVEFVQAEHTIHVIASRTNTGQTLQGPFPILSDSFFDEIAADDCCSYPRNALITFANDPYMLKYDINSVIGRALVDNNGEMRGAITAMDMTAIHHAEETFQLLQEAAEVLGKLLFVEAHNGE